MPRVVVLGGVNGSGKTTAAPDLLTDVLKIPTFVNADAIARGLNGLHPESVSMQAGQIMLQRLASLAESGNDFAFETTLASKSYAKWLQSLKQSGFEIHIYYYWLSSPDLAIARVQQRVKSGGHAIPEDDIRRRYARSIRNFLDLYCPLADWWEVFDNSNSLRELIGIGDNANLICSTAEDWNVFLRSADRP